MLRKNCPALFAISLDVLQNFSLGISSFISVTLQNALLEELFIKILSQISNTSLKNLTIPQSKNTETSMPQCILLKLLNPNSVLETLDKIEILINFVLEFSKTQKIFNLKVSYTYIPGEFYYPNRRKDLREWNSKCTSHVAEFSSACASA